ncbi:MAG: lipid-A-disaccharide synthase N-terminal domain-containing protein [Verrucomicrobia bacterium]|nr:lipid-A-disaccharide synthase N-terminal domain-containing protein [Verrucomicrobiota bacterium]MBI3867326.1 lipid-A-disaccharide synthase N-terminal domain-containing protein [Verrucomicrobiota bacterium]
MIDGLTFAALSGAFLGVDWTTWKVVGWLGNICFFTRFAVQWYATERRQQVVVPSAFWWLSLTGCLCLLSYACFETRNAIFIFANAFSWIPYMRNLVIHHRSRRAARSCACGLRSPVHAIYCAQCGAKLPE